MINNGVKKALAILTLTSLVAANAAFASSVTEGKELAFDRKKGNCLACHAIEDGTLPGTSGPPLLVMEARFPDRAVLKAQISNPLERNPDTLMPPFGLHGILSDGEIDKIVDYLYTL